MPFDITVFIVEKDESMARAMTRLIASAGFKSVCVGSVAELTASNPPTSGAVIVADVSTARQYKRSLPSQLNQGNRALPVIYVTDFDSDHIRNEAQRNGAVGYFRKPVDKEALLDAIVFAVKQPVPDVCDK